MTNDDEGTTDLAARETVRPRWVTDGGFETDLIFHHGVDLRAFAAYPLLETSEGRALLTNYYRGFAQVAGRAGAGLLLETPTWRASPDWAETLGGSRDDVRRINLESVSFLADGTPLADAIATLRAQAPPDDLLLNCAHPTPIAAACRRVTAGPHMSPGCVSTPHASRTPRSMTPTSSMKVTSPTS